MDVKKVKGAAGIYGQAQIRLAKGLVLIKMDKEFGGQEYQIAKDKAPDNVLAGHWQVAINSKGDQLFSIRPIAGTFRAKFLKLAAAKDSAPAPVQEETKYRDDTTGEVRVGKPQLVFTAIIQVDEEYEFPVKFPYRFEENEQGNAFIAYRKMGKRIEALIDFMTVAGVMDKDLPYTENVLPALEELLNDADETFLVTVNKGWIDAFSPPLTPSKKKATKAKPSKKK